MFAFLIAAAAMFLAVAVSAAINLGGRANSDNDCASPAVEKPAAPRVPATFDRATVGKVGLARSSMGLICGNPPPSPAGMRIPTRLRLQRATFLKARSGPATPRERRSRSRQFPRWKSAVPVAPPPGCPSTGSIGSLLQSCSKPHKMINVKIWQRASSPHVITDARATRSRKLR